MEIGEKTSGNVVQVLKWVGILGGGYLLYRYWKKQQDLKEAQQAGQIANSELNQLQQQGVTSSYADSQFEIWCNDIVEAVNGCSTDEDTIYSIMDKMQNDADIRKLIAQFSVRYYMPCAGTQPISYSIWLFDSQHFGGGLATFLQYGMSSSEIAKVNSTLKANGVNFQF